MIADVRTIKSNRLRCLRCLLDNGEPMRTPAIMAATGLHQQAALRSLRSLEAMALLECAEAVQGNAGHLWRLRIAWITAPAATVDHKQEDPR